MKKYALALMPLMLFPMQTATAASPEEIAVKEYITALSAGSKDNVANAMCKTIKNESPEKQVLMRFLFGPEGLDSDTAKSEDQIKSIRKLIDLSKLSYTFVDTGPKKTAAVVRVSGQVREVNTWKTVTRFLRERDKSNYAFVTSDNGNWRFCGFLSVSHAEKMALLYNWNDEKAKTVKLTANQLPEQKIIDIDLSKLYPRKTAENTPPQQAKKKDKIAIINIDLEKLYPPEKKKIVPPKNIDLSLSKLDEKQKGVQTPTEQQVVSTEVPEVDIDLGKLRQAGLLPDNNEKPIEVANAPEDNKGEILYQDFTLSAGKRWIVVASREDPAEAKLVARGFLDHFPTTQVIKTDNGWYAVVIGNLPTKSASEKLKYFKETQIVPKDAFLSTGRRFLKRHWASKTLLKAEKL